MSGKEFAHQGQDLCVSVEQANDEHVMKESVRTCASGQELVCHGKDMHVSMKQGEIGH